MGNVMGRYQQAFAALAEKNEGASCHL